MEAEVGCWFGVALCVMSCFGCTGSEYKQTEHSPSHSIETEKPIESKRYSVVVRPAPKAKGVQTKTVGFSGDSSAIACQVCHSQRPSDASKRNSSDLKDFHQGLQIKHGQLSCAACHDPLQKYEGLHLADGQKVSFVEAMQLCAQCHGPQFRDYQHGSHGGMNGYWDLDRGGRERNHCMHCHDPHSPQIAIVIPVPGPRDRFLARENEPHAAKVGP